MANLLTITKGDNTWRKIEGLKRKIKVVLGDPPNLKGGLEQAHQLRFKHLKPTSRER